MKREPSDSFRAAMTWREQYMSRYYDPSRGYVSGTVEFHEMCAAACPANARILEIGAGPTNPTSRYLAALGELHGVDPDPDVEKNEFLVRASVALDKYPYDDGFFGLCVSNYVCEHVSDPFAHLSEAFRVLQPGGAYVFRTPNKFHYVALISAATPHWVHKKVANRARGLPKDAHDPYPTCYRMNSVAEVRHLAARVGFSVERLELVEKEPSYAMLGRPFFLAGMAYERLVNATDVLGQLRSNLFVVLRKPATPT